MNPQRIINLYHFLRRSEELKLPFTVPRLAALAACSIDTQNSGTLKEMFGASQAFWSITLKELRENGLVKNTVQRGWPQFKATKMGNIVLEVTEETMNLEAMHDSTRVKKALRHTKIRSAYLSKVQSLQGAKQQEAHGPSPSGGEAR